MVRSGLDAVLLAGVRSVGRALFCNGSNGALEDLGLGLGGVLGVFGKSFNDWHFSCGFCSWMLLLGVCLRV